MSAPHGDPTATTSSSTMMSADQPVGVRFRPTDEELVFAYLWEALSALLPRPAAGRPQSLPISHSVTATCRSAQAAAPASPQRWGGGGPTLIQLPEINILRHDPRQLPESACFDGEWYFLYRPAPTKGSKKERSVRTDEGGTIGYWKATGKDLEIRTHAQILRNDSAVLLGSTVVVGMKKKLVFYSKSGSVTPPSPLPVPLPSSSTAPGGATSSSATAPDGDDAVSTRGKEPLGPLAPVKGVKTEWIMDEYRLEELKRTPALLEQPKISVMVGGVETRTSVSEFLESVVVCRVFYRNGGGGTHLAVHQLLGSAAGISFSDERSVQPPLQVDFTSGGRRMNPAFRPGIELSPGLSEQTQAAELEHYWPRGGPLVVDNPASEASLQGNRMASEDESGSLSGTNTTDSGIEPRKDDPRAAADVEYTATLVADMHMDAQPAEPQGAASGASGWGSGSRGRADEDAAAAAGTSEQEPACLLLGAAPGALEQRPLVVTLPQLSWEHAELQEEASQQDPWLTDDESTWMHLLLDTAELVDYGEARGPGEAGGMLSQGGGAAADHALLESVVGGVPAAAGTAAAAESSSMGGSAVAAYGRTRDILVLTDAGQATAAEFRSMGMEDVRLVNEPEDIATREECEASRHVRRRYAGGEYASTGRGGGNDEGGDMGGIRSLK